ncbi:XRE family transcriptional regulator [Sphingomonas sp. R-74633]|uniref:XRE family transcriptional regulator n=1 Tax=Sphingomonas sp. R-74633 TaxID=2751188 RepID=UPI0015D2A978|nr:XRE family transcriptional regulator [Sphingomonas sp. R-74633]NYT43131.1 XRE family transcriptional regulator [Sphingomonas sp. R-74633]
MHLRDWLKREEINFPEFGAKIERTAQAVQRYASGERIPDRETMPRIVLATRGEVTANDFYDLGSVHADTVTTAQAALS